MDTVIAESSFGTLNRIRVETALSRFPIHRLSKKGHIAISIKDDDMDVRWEVTHNSKHGQAGPLAYKLDTLIVNRKIDEIPRPIPKAIRLGSLYEIARQLGMGGDTSQIKRALRQNASTFVEFSIKYKRKNGGEKHLTLADNRYGVIFTGVLLRTSAGSGFGSVGRADHRRESVQRSSVSRGSDSAGGALVSAVSPRLRACLRTADRARPTRGSQLHLALGPSLCARVE